MTTISTLPAATLPLIGTESIPADQRPVEALMPAPAGLGEHHAGVVNLEGAVSHPAAPWGRLRPFPNTGTCCHQ